MEKKVQNKNTIQVDVGKSIKKAKKFLYFAVVSSLLFFIFSFSTIVLDVKKAGDSGELIGLATINEFFFNIFKQVEWLKILTDIFGIIAIFVVAFFACLGVYQLVDRKSLRKVDIDIYMLGATYILIAIVYVFFELIVVNYRPILVDGIIEASFPSSHTLLIFTVLLTSIYEINKRINNEKIKKILIIISYCIMVITFFARFICGYHWFTDVLASLLISVTISSIFYASIEILKSKNILKD